MVVRITASDKKKILCGENTINVVQEFKLLPKWKTCTYNKGMHLMVTLRSVVEVGKYFFLLLCAISLQDINDHGSLQFPVLSSS